jgi:hypothetical protein
LAQWHEFAIGLSVVAISFGNGETGGQLVKSVTLVTLSPGNARVEDNIRAVYLSAKLTACIVPSDGHQPLLYAT